jgi:hypothetical protein
MELIKIEKKKACTEILLELPDGIHKLDISLLSAARQAISRTLKRTNPEIKFSTEIKRDSDSNEYLEVNKETSKQTA